jgi:hypothetical protein
MILAECDTEPIPTPTNSYTELATGMHYQETPGEGPWLESNPAIEIDPNGGAKVEQCAHKIHFAANINTQGAINFTTSDGKILRSHIIGLSYFDSTGQSALIASLKNSTGVLAEGDNKLTYPDAFDVDGGGRIDVQYVNTTAGAEQNVIILEKLPSPAEWGLNPATTRLELLTEFLDPPAPEKRQHLIAGQTVDSVLDFGEMQMGRGKAYLIGNQTNPSRSNPVNKHWQKLEGRDFLIEELNYSAIEAQLNMLPEHPIAKAGQKSSSVHRIASTKRQLPERKAAKVQSDKVIQTASLSATHKGLLIDYSILSSSSNFTF